MERSSLDEEINKKIHPVRLFASSVEELLASSTRQSSEFPRRRTRVIVAGLVIPVRNRRLWFRIRQHITSRFLIGSAGSDQSFTCLFMCLGMLSFAIIGDGMNLKINGNSLSCTLK